jgi:Asp-tRNA(Asn)/Glu-tRNA(Gln) amidotransferase A subunit family amidase
VSLYKSGKLTPTDVAEALIPLISKDPAGEHSLAFLESKAELVRGAAKVSTKRYQEGKSLGPLDGVPVAVKDEVDLKGYKRTLASDLDFTNKDDETAWCVKLWEEAGAIVIGKTNMHEIGLGMSLLHQPYRLQQSLPSISHALQHPQPL